MNLSIITVSLNAEKYIDKTINSILNQTDPVYEYIIIDGNSKDRTYNIICSYEKKFKEKGIRYIYSSDKDRGISDAFNKGIKKATGDLIGIINADDELMPDANKILKKYYEKSNAGVFYGNCLWIDKKRNFSYISRPRHNLDKLLYNMILIHSSTFVKKDIYNKYGRFKIDYKYCMDKELLYRFYKNGVKFKYIDFVLTKFKSGGISDRNKLNVYKEGSKMALSYGEPFIKVKIIEFLKCIRGIIIDSLKNTFIYKIIKKTKVIK
ncbi:MAG: glycosyltransferase [Lachnospiraceae bacterium]